MSEITFKRFTKKGYNALTNEVLRLARDLSSTDKCRCSVGFGDSYIYLDVWQQEGEPRLFINIYRERFGMIDDYKKLFSLCDNLPQISLGRYMTLIKKACEEADRARERSEHNRVYSFEF